MFLQLAWCEANSSTITTISKNSWIICVFTQLRVQNSSIICQFFQFLHFYVSVSFTLLESLHFLKKFCTSVSLILLTFRESVHLSTEVTQLGPIINVSSKHWRNNTSSNVFTEVIYSFYCKITETSNEDLSCNRNFNYSIMEVKKWQNFMMLNCRVGKVWGTTSFRT